VADQYKHPADLLTGFDIAFPEISYGFEVADSPFCRNRSTVRRASRSSRLLD